MTGAERVETLAGYSLREVMRRHHLSHRTLRAAIDSGELRAVLLPGRSRRLLVTAEALADYLRRRNGESRQWSEKK